MNRVQSLLADFELRDQYRMVFGGQWETIEETNRELAVVIGLTIFLVFVFVALAVQYERLSNTLVILATAPLPLIGVAPVLWITPPADVRPGAHRGVPAGRDRGKQCDFTGRIH